MEPASRTAQAWPFRAAICPPSLRWGQLILLAELVSSRPNVPGPACQIRRLLKPARGRHPFALLADPAIGQSAVAWRDAVDCQRPHKAGAGTGLLSTSRRRVAYDHALRLRSWSTRTLQHLEKG